MSVTERINRAWRALWTVPKQSAATRKISVPWNINASEPAWQMVDSERFVEEGFAKNSNIYAAVSYKAKASASPPLRAYTGERATPKLLGDKHPLSKLARKPNPFHTWTMFQMLNTIYLNIAGNCYVYGVRASRASAVQRMYTLRPDRVRIIFNKEKSLFDDDWLMGFLYLWNDNLQDAIPMLPDDVEHIKFPYPGDPREGLGYGMSPILPAAQSGDVDNAVTRFLKNFFDKGAMFSGAIKYDAPISEEDAALARERWMQIYGGADNWHKIAILDQGGDYTRVAPNFDEMGFDSIDERSETRILATLGVPPILIGTRVGLQRSTYSNYEEARRAFWQDTELHELRLFEDGYNSLLENENEATFVQFDISQVPALRQDINRQVDSAYRLWQMGVPSQQALDTVGLDVGRIPEGDVAFIAGSLKPVEQMTEPPQPPPPQLVLPPKPSPADGEENPVDEEAQKARRKSLESAAKKVDRAMAKKESVFARAARACFEADKKEISAIVGAAEKAARARKASINWWDVETDVLNYLENAGDENWRETFAPLIEGTVWDVGEIWSTELGIAFNVRNLRGEEWFQAYTLVFAQPINQTTSNDIQLTIAKGMEEGWSISEMQKNLGKLFDQYMKGNLSAEELAWFTDRLPEHRTEMIARTETIRAAGAGAHQLYQEWGVKKRAWLATDDDRTRDSHREAEQKYGRDGSVGPLPMDEPFIVGGYEMMYPGDASRGAPPEEFINCRCTSIPIVED